MEIRNLRIFLVGLWNIFDELLKQGVIIEIENFWTIKPIYNVDSHLDCHAIGGNYEGIYFSEERQVFMIHLFSQ